MAFKRVALVLSMIGIMGMSLVNVAQAATPATPTFSVTSTQANGLRATNCPITSSHGHAGAYICETTIGSIVWTQGGVVVAIDNLVIGTDYRIYHDSGPGWSWLQNGVASSTANPSTIGLFGSGATISVVGTDNRLYCNTTTSPGVWAGWRVC